MAARGCSLTRLAESVEEVAAGLHNFRDRLPRETAQITAALGELFAISSLLRRIDETQGNLDLARSLYRIQGDIDILRPSLQLTLDECLRMFGRSGALSYQTVWEDLLWQMERVERYALHPRLILYHDFLTAQLQVMQGRSQQGLQDMRRQLRTLRDAQEQEVGGLRIVRPAITDFSASICPTLLSRAS